MAGNVHALVGTDWVAHRLDDPEVVIADVDEDTTLYDTGHIPGSVGSNDGSWTEYGSLVDVPVER